jgi:ankyrin repeat protein
METRASCPSVPSVINFIKKDTTVESFYTFITNNDTNFDYDINAYVYANNLTPLYIAAMHENIPLVRALIKMGAYINPITSERKTPLDEAIKKNNQLLIKILKYYGAKSADEEYDKEIEELFKTALKEKNVKNLAEILKNNLIRLPHHDMARASQLRRAAEKGYFEIVKLLANYGGEINEVAFGISATTAMAARQNNCHEIADYLEQLQKERYEKLKVEVKLEKYHEHGKIFMLGLFADRSSHLSQGLSEASRDIATKIFSFV